MNQTELLFYKNTKLPLDLIKIILKYIKCYTCDNVAKTLCIYCDECFYYKIGSDECSCNRCCTIHHICILQ